jgi:DNA topoisomerase-1
MSSAVAALSAESAGLRYVDDSEPGLTRRRCGRGFVYLDGASRCRIVDQELIDRLSRLAVPPAWTDVWYCADHRGHIQATGRDAKHRKQYRYHDDWQRIRDEAKFDSLIDFGVALPSLRQRVNDDMTQRQLTFERVVATTVWLLDHSLIRVGNSEYARHGHSYGLTTLLDEHVDVGGQTLRFRFTGKSNKPHDVILHDRRVARTVARCQELPGQQLLQYVAEDGVRAVDSRDVNDYIREVTNTDFTAKTFRTWGGSVYALRSLRSEARPDSISVGEQQVRQAIKATAAMLRNTPAVCKRSYVHPLVLESHLDGRLDKVVRRHSTGRSDETLLSIDEVNLLTLLS